MDNKYIIILIIVYIYTTTLFPALGTKYPYTRPNTVTNIQGSPKSYRLNLALCFF